MGFNDIIQSMGFEDLDEQEQIARLLKEDMQFSRAYEKDPIAARDILRKHAKRKPAEPSKAGMAFGTGVRQFFSGIGESYTDLAQLPFEAAAALSSEEGGGAGGRADKAIEEFSEKYFPEPTDAVGRIARRSGELTGLGSQFFFGGAYLGATKLPGIAKAARFLTADATTEIGMGALAGTVGGVVGEISDDPLHQTGAEILSWGAGGLAIAARANAIRKAASKADGAQPPLRHGRGSSKADDAAVDAFDQATTEEMKQFQKNFAEAAEGATPNGPAIPLNKMDEAAEFQAREAMEEMTKGVHRTLDVDTTKRLTEAGERISRKFGVEFNPDFPIGAQLSTLIKANPRASKEIMDDIGLTAADLLADGWQITNSDAGRTLQQLAAASRRSKKRIFEALSPEDAAALEAAGSVNAVGMSLFRRMENTRRGMLVSQIATAARNFETQVVNLSVHSLEQGMEHGILKLPFFNDAARAAHPTAAFGLITRLFGGAFLKKGKVSQLVAEIGGTREIKKSGKLGKTFENELGALYSHYVADVGDIVGSGRFAYVEKLSRVLNSVNRFQEFGIRRAVFTAELERLLKVRGIDLADLEKAGRLGAIPREDIKGAVSKALEVTWGKGFNVYDEGRAASFAGAAINFINKAQFGPFAATQIIPFPRFMANALKWQFEHSPVPLMRQIMSKEGRAAMAAGDITKGVKAITGASLFLSAYQVRSGELAGERWYEIRPSADVAEFLGMEPGGTIDTRPYNPFASFLFVADIIHKMNQGTLDTLDARDIAMGIASTSLRAGAGMYVLDQFLDSFRDAVNAGAGDGKNLIPVAGQAGIEFLGAAWSGMLVPMQQLRDIAAHFDETQRTVKDASAEPGVGQFKRKIPYADSNLPDVQLPTRGAAPRTETPALRQFTGITTRGPKNAAEIEFDKHGFSRSNILPSSGDDDWDRLNSKYLGPLVEHQISAFVKTPAYKGLSRDLQKLLLSKQLTKLRAVARKQAAAEDPAAWVRVRESRRSGPERRIINRSRRSRVERRRAMAREARNE